MARRPKRPCKRCSRPTNNNAGWCDKCKAEGKAGSAIRRAGSRWTAYSRRYRAEHPLCKPCLDKGKYSATAAVHHIRPVTGPEDPLFWDPSNHESRCRDCHEKLHGRKR